MLYYKCIIVHLWYIRYLQHSREITTFYMTIEIFQIDCMKAAVDSSSFTVYSQK